VRRPLPGYRWLIPVIGSLVVLAAPTPAGLSLEGQRVLAVLVLAIGLWGLEALPPGATGVLAIVALVLTGAVAGIREGLVGFADPIPYFLIGVLTMGVAVARSGLAERVAHVLLARGRGRAGAVYAHLLMAMPPLTLLLPSATTRTAILVHIYNPTGPWSESRWSASGELSEMSWRGLSRTSRTLLIRSAGVNGFPSSSMLASRTPWRRMASSV
jgi:di/tricarboxylate transporter